MPKPLSVSIASSFNVRHFSENISDWPHQVSCSNVEVYAFMHNCLESLFPETHQREETALIALSRASENPKEVARIANLINCHFKGMNVSALTSFLPEILAPEGSPTWQMAQKALTFLISVISSLRDEYNHACSTLVMAGGSCFDGMWQGQDENERFIVVNRLSKEKAIERLLCRLDIVARAAESHGVTLAISMEPGPLYAIGGWDSLLAFCEAIESCSIEIKSRVGLNLDIAHWAFLSNITANMVHDTSMIKKRIVHSHISDHDRGHCSDAMPGTFHEWDDFRPWIELLKELASSTDKSRLPYSGFLSCEHESACHFGTIADSVDKLRGWIEEK